MARGKNAASSARRRAAQHADTVARLTAEIAAERDALDQAQSALAGVDALRSDLAAEVGALERDTAGESEHLRAEVDFPHAALKEQKRRADAVQAAWDKTVIRAIDAAGGGIEGYEKVFAIIRHEAHISDSPHAGIGLEGATRIQVARGERKKHVEASGEHLMLPAIFSVFRGEHLQRADAVDLDLANVNDLLNAGSLTPPQKQVVDDLEPVAQAVQASSSSTMTADAIAAWHPMIWLSSWGTRDAADLEAAGVDTATPDYWGKLPDGGVSDDLGARTTPVMAPATQLSGNWPLPTPALSATHRTQIAHRPAAELIDQWGSKLAEGEVLNGVFGPHARSYSAGPRHPRPGRAAALRHLYALSALGVWLRPESTRAGPSSLWGMNAVALTAAAAYWLPAGQTQPYADSEPLAEDDVNELVLPFPQVFLGFAEPLELAPRRRATKDEAKILADLDLAVTDIVGKKHPTFFDVLMSGDTPESLGVLSADQVVACRGARVEGVLLMADLLGRLEDRFAWCVSIPSGANGSLGRHVVPASLSATAFRAIVENLAAVLAWAEWHEPDVEVGQMPAGSRLSDIVDLASTPAFRRDADRAGAGGVRVLNVRSTTKASNGTSEPTGRHVAPHVRRGHWRRQRFGPGRREVKRIRIAPVVVNAHLPSDQIARVYVLPTS